MTDRCSVVETCVAASRSQSKANDGNVAITLDIQHLQNWHVLIDCGAWIRIVTNLVGNAIKYTHAGHISVKLEASMQHGSLAVRLEVEDTGCGMSKDFLTNGLFTPFKQENPLTDGTGLGLSIAKQLVDSLHGKLWVKSKSDVGTKIRVRLELQSASPTAVSTAAFVLDQLQVMTSPETDKIADSVLTTAADWLPCQVLCSSQLLTTSSKSEIAMTDTMLASLLAQDDEHVLPEIARRYSQLIVFVGLKKRCLPPDLTALPLECYLVNQPIGPKKLLHILAERNHVGQSGEATPEELTSTMEKVKSLASAGRRAGRPQEADAEQSRSKALLVEDNSINMKVSEAVCLGDPADR